MVNDYIAERERPEIRELFEMVGREATDEELDHFGRVCRISDVSYEQALHVIVRMEAWYDR